MPAEFRVDSLNHFEIAEDGRSIEIEVEDASGGKGTLIFSVDCLNSLVMSLPAMLTAAVQRSGKDPSLRIAYPLDRFKVELAKDLRSRILTLMTPDGFAVSFCLSETQRRQIGSEDPSMCGSPGSSTHIN